MKRLPTWPLPFDGDEPRWDSALRHAARVHHAVHAELARRTTVPPALRAAAEAQLLIPERTQHGWLRWETFDASGRPHPAGRLRVAGVYDPAQNSGWLGICRTVWGRRPPGYIWTIAGRELPRPVPVGRAAAFTVTAFATLGPATSALPPAVRLIAAGALGAAVAAGLPAALQHATRRRVRVVDNAQAYAPVFFRLLAGSQHLRALAKRSGHYELARAAAILPRLLWDAAGLVVLAAGDEEARELLLGYAQSLELLVEEAVEVERQEEAVESAIRDEGSTHRAHAAVAALPEGLLPRASLEEARLELEELGQGLRHARDVLEGEADGSQNHVERGEGHAR